MKRYWSPLNPEPYKSLKGSLTLWAGILGCGVQGSRVSRCRLQALGPVSGSFRKLGVPFKGSFKGSIRVLEIPKIRDTLFWGPYNKDPTI